LKPAQANSLRDLIFKTPSQKELVVWLKVLALSSRPGTAKKKKGRNQEDQGSKPAQANSA
jgi:hypothetical protein